MALTYLSLFAGCGGGDAGFHRAGLRCVGQVEIDAFRRRVLERHFPGVPRWDDIRSFDPDELGWEHPDVVLFGSPCEDLSIAGRRAGLRGDRSGLFFEATRVIRQCQPALAVWENVCGALSSAAGDDFAAVLDELADCGALDIAWRVLDSRFFGVPQCRRRVFLVADFGGERAGQVLFEPEGSIGHPPARLSARATVARTLTASDGGPSGKGDHHTFVLTETAHAVTAHGRPRYDPNGEDFVIYLTLRTNWRNNSSPVTEARMLVYGPTNHRDGRTYHELDVSRSVTAFSTAQQFGLIAQTRIDTAGVRRITPCEAERLQGLPDGWTCVCGANGEYGRCSCPVMPRYAALGDAMTATVLEWIGRRIVSVLS